MHYDKVADFISLATEVVPELLNISEKAQLVMSLRARVSDSTTLLIVTTSMIHAWMRTVIALAIPAGAGALSR